MASRIQGITVEIGGDTTKLSKALESVNKEEPVMSFTGLQNTKRKVLRTGKSATATRTRLPIKPSAM